MNNGRNEEKEKNKFRIVPRTDLWNRTSDDLSFIMVICQLVKE